MTALTTAVASAVPLYVLPWSPAGTPRRPRRVAQTAPTGKPLPMRLGHRHDVGHDAGVLEAEPLAGAAEAGLDLVDHQQQAALVAQLADAAEVLGVGGYDAALALHGLEQHRGDRRIDRRRRARRGRRSATWRKPSGIGKNGSCLAGWPVAASVGERASVEAAVGADDARAGRGRRTCGPA